MAGRPRHYDSSRKLKEKCDEYFKICEENDERPLVTGLALHLGFESRQSIHDYMNRVEKDNCGSIIRRALTVIEMHLEKKLTTSSNSTTGVIFALKQFGWTDTKEVDVSVSDIRLLVDDGDQDL